jgi:hypothetical protein
MYRCVLKKDDKYYCFEREPSPDLQQALCFESRYDADWTQENEFKDSEVIPVIKDHWRDIHRSASFIVLN